MESGEQSLILCKKWPELTAVELVEHYNEIKNNRKLIISDLWTNPGRVDPKLFSKSIKVNLDNQKSTTETDEKSDLNTVASNNEANNSGKLSIGDEFLDEDKNEEDINEIFKIENKVRRESTNVKKVANIDKIFDDMRKNYVITSQQVEDDGDGESQKVIAESVKQDAAAAAGTSSEEVELEQAVIKTEDGKMDVQETITVESETKQQEEEETVSAEIRDQDVNKDVNENETESSTAADTIQVENYVNTEEKPCVEAPVESSANNENAETSNHQVGEAAVDNSGTMETSSFEDANESVN